MAQLDQSNDSRKKTSPILKSQFIESKVKILPKQNWKDSSKDSKNKEKVMIEMQPKKICTNRKNSSKKNTETSLLDDGS